MNTERIFQEKKWIRKFREHPNTNKKDNTECQQPVLKHCSSQQY